MGNESNIYIKSINTLVEVVNRFDSSSERYKLLEPYMVFIEKSTSRNTKGKYIYKSRKFSATQDFKKSICNLFLNNLKSFISGKVIQEYDPIPNVDEAIEVMKSDYLDSCFIVSDLANDKDKSEDISKTTNLSKLKCVAVRFSYQEKEEIHGLTIYRKYSHIKKLDKTLTATLAGSNLNELTQDILYFDGIPDAFEYDGHFYILNRYNFSMIIDLQDDFKDFIDGKKADIEKYDLINDTNGFIELCKSNGTHIKRLYKIIVNDGFEKLNESRETLPQILENVKSKLKNTDQPVDDLEIDGEGRISYTKEESVSVILTLLLDYFAESLVTKSIMVVASAKHYSNGGEKGGENS